MSACKSIGASPQSRLELREPALVFGAFVFASWLLPLLPHTVLLQSLVGAGAVLALFYRIARRGERLSELGLRVDNLPGASAVFLVVTAPLVAPAIGISGEEISITAGEIFRYFLWALFQQFLVVAGFWRNFRGSALLAALVFALAHAPNLPLMALVLLSETIWLFVFIRYRNLAGLALAHCLAALLVSHALVPDWIPTLRVGLGYWQR